MNDAPLVSVVMCTRNRADLIGQAIDSVLANTHQSLEFTIVDQSDNDETGEIVRARAGTDSRLRYVHTPIAGLSRAYNIGIRESRGEILAFTDDDCIAPADWLSNIVRVFQDEPDVSLLYGQVLCAESLQDVEGVVPALHFPAPEKLGRAYGFRVVGMGANFAARSSFFKKVGLFDQTLGGGGPLRSSQDYDIQFRAFRKGLVTMLSPDVWVSHYGIRNSVQWPATLFAYGTGDGGFYMKHARCGDLKAAWLLGRTMTRQTGAVLIKPLLGRKHDPSYLKGLFAGARGSFRYRVNRSERIYIG